MFGFNIHPEKMMAVSIATSVLQQVIQSLDQHVTSNMLESDHAVSDLEALTRNINEHNLQHFVSSLVQYYPKIVDVAYKLTYELRHSPESNIATLIPSDELTIAYQKVGIKPIGYYFNLKKD